MEFVKDLLSHLGVDLALTCLHSEPRLQSKDYAKRELISPLLYVASVLAGKLRLCQLDHHDILLESSLGYLGWNKLCLQDHKESSTRCQLVWR